MKKRCRFAHKRPTIGLALSGGSVRGLCYIGFLKVLEDEKIPIDYIAGTSIGAVIGAFYCAGMHPKEMEDIVAKINWESFMDFTCEYTGLLDGNKIEKFLRKNLKVKNFEDLYIHFATTAVDVDTGEGIIFDKGDIAEAVRASISIPGVFTPVKIGNHLLVDGGVLDPIPIDVLKGKVDKIIAIDLSIPTEEFAHARAVDGESETWKQFKEHFILSEVDNMKSYLKEKKAFPNILLRLLRPRYILRLLQGKPVDMPPLFHIAMKSHHLMTNELIRMKLEKFKPDLLIKPKITDATFIEFDKAKYLLAKGEEAARDNLKAIKKLAKMPY